MAKAKMQWIKVEGAWHKVRVMYAPAKAWTRGLKCGGWEARATVDMSRRGEVHSTRITGALRKENI